MVFLDFDGVLFDSSPEAFAVGMLARGWDIQAIDKAVAGVPGKQFNRYRYLVRHASDVPTLVDIIMDSAHGDIDDEKIVAAFLKKSNQMSVAKNSRERDDFWQSRERFRSSWSEKWWKLTKPYPFFKQVLPLIRNNNDRFCIITTKDRESVQALLFRQGLELAQNGLIAGLEYEAAGGKRPLLIERMQKNSVLRGIYIDDNPHHLDDTKDIPGLVPILAGWGYCPPQSQSGWQADRVLAAITELLRVGLCPTPHWEVTRPFPNPSP